jgi:hypothetical protein
MTNLDELFFFHRINFIITVVAGILLHIGSGGSPKFRGTACCRPDEIIEADSTYRAGGLNPVNCL